MAFVRNRLQDNRPQLDRDIICNPKDVYSVNFQSDSRQIPQIIYHLLILSINFIGMIRQKRWPMNRIQNNLKGNNQVLPDQGTNKCPSKCEKEIGLEVQRTGLSELCNNARNIQSFFLNIEDGNKYQLQSHPKQKENIFRKISQLVRNKDIPIPICHQNHSKPPICSRQRPYTSLSHHNKSSLDNAQTSKLSVVLNLFKDQPSKPPERTSTSRALINYSIVYRHNSNEGFRVKKDTSLMNKFVHLSAQKIVLNQKDKIAKSFEGVTTVKRKAIKRVKGRYRQEQQFELAGWDYIE